MDVNRVVNEHPEQYSLCLRVRAQLQDYIEGYLDVVAAETVRAHLAVCVLCRREYLEIKETIRLVQTLPYLSPSRDVAPIVMKAIGGPPRGGWWHWRSRPRKPDS